MLHIKFGFDWPSGFREEDVNIMVIYMYIAQGQGQITPWAQNIFIKIIKSSVHLLISSKFSAIK